ncbi:thiamine phosphate synthase [Exiguobacterium sp. KRL4]|uniref:thiamine phosphate synthase n=1 Tax=Exiguobacterium sp. KRL4 TaxID=1914536 RepID=UPI0008F94FDC|nr:thiamine phosphate synthase [Exiguobacterium sp. KRL4]OIN66933.1 thiamine phosphate synthase [Exiguobacterium sp. KRL4]
MANLHILTTGQQPRSWLERVIPVLASDVDRIHLREPMWSVRELVACIETLQGCGVRVDQLIVHDRLDAALVTGTTIHLTQHSIPVDRVRSRFPDIRIGQSVHSLTEAMAAEQAGADYVMYGHIYATASKAALPPRGLDALAQVVDWTSVPVIALGGIASSRVSDVLTTGCAGVAVLSGILGQAEPVKSAKQYRAVVDG